MKQKPKAVFDYMGGYYKLSIYLFENATEKQNNWAELQGKHIIDNEMQATANDMKADGFQVKIIR